MNLHAINASGQDEVEGFRPFVTQRGRPFQRFVALASGQYSNIMHNRFPSSGSNAISPDLMTPTERVQEIGEILAAGLIRLRARQQKAAGRQSGESSVDFSGDQSVHG